MTRQDILDAVTERFGDRVEMVHPNERRTYIYTKPEDVPSLARFLFEELELRYVIATGIDTRSDIEVIHHFAADPQHMVVNIKTAVPKPQAELESIATFIPAAEWIEREIMDLFGMTFLNHPRPERLILSDDWPEGVHPLRRDYK